MNEIEGDREARSIAISLGRVVREARRRLHLTQSALAGAVGLRRSRISEIERGLATGTPLIVWARLGMVLGRPLAMAFSRDLAPPLPADAGHLAGQELVLRLARQTGRTGLFELATRPMDPSHSVDACIRDDPNRTLILNEIWNRFDDLGRAARSPTARPRRPGRSDRPRRRSPVPRRGLLAPRRHGGQPGARRSLP